MVRELRSRQAVRAQARGQFKDMVYTKQILILGPLGGAEQRSQGRECRRALSNQNARVRASTDTVHDHVSSNVTGS